MLDATWRTVDTQADTTPFGMAQALGALGLSFMITLVADAILFGVAPHLAKQHPVEFGALSYQFLVLGIAISAYVLVLRPFHTGLSSLGFRFPGWSTLLTAAAVVLPTFLGVALLYLLFNTFWPGYHLHGNTKDLFPGSGPHGVGEQLLVVLWVGIEAPIAEETLFRGIMFQGMRRFFERWLPIRRAVLAAALLSGFAFGIVHFELHTLPILIFIGIVLAYVFHYARSIYASMLVHAIINTMAVLSLLFGS